MKREVLVRTREQLDELFEAANVPQKERAFWLGLPLPQIVDLDIDEATIPGWVEGSTMSILPDS